MDVELIERELRKKGAKVVKVSYGALFDLVAKIGEETFIIKSVKNIDSVSEKQAKELGKLCTILESNPIIVGERSNLGKLEDGKVYKRYGITAMNLKTVERIIDGRITVKKKKGRETVPIDPEALREERMKRGMSLSELARVLGVSKETVYRYEHGLMEPSYDKARKLEEIFGQGIRGKVIEKPKVDVEEELPGIYGKIRSLGFRIGIFKRALFRAAAKRRMKLIIEEERRICEEKKVEEIIGVSKLTDSKPVIIGEMEKPGVICVSSGKELVKILKKKGI